MREKIWRDCPTCGSKASMKRENHRRDIFVREGHRLTIKGLSGQFCGVCKEGFYDLASQRRISSELGKFLARIDSEKSIPPKYIISVKELAKRYDVSTKRVHQMMDEGKVRYVNVADLHLPLDPKYLGKAHIAATQTALAISSRH